MKLSSRPRTPSKLPDSLHHRLNMYALAASAAGVGMLPLSRASQAKVVYTPAHERVIGSLWIDLNHDGTSDFMFQDGYGRCGVGGCWTILTAQGWPRSNGIAYKLDQSYRLASALKKGSMIDSKRNFTAFATMVEYWWYDSKGGYRGYWRDVAGRYLGLELQIKGKTYYGWARFNVKQGSIINAVLTGYAYETIPNKGIIAGKTKGPDVITVPPGSLGRLALGKK